ncbi:FAD/NAD(P)-binding domain-containing protein [Mycena polygramma]|nr:FAD/NAD(P)-binding domain-containing protein [Mycena polygramma]
MAALAKTAVDVIILGGGPAGLSAALALSRVLRTSILFDSQEYRNAPAGEMHTIIGFDGAPPAQFRATARREIEHYGKATFVNHKAHKVQRTPAGFMVDEKPEWTSRKLIIASGSSDILPEVPGMQAIWGKKVFHCAFCHGNEVANKRGALWGAPMLQNLPFFAITPKLTLLLNGASVPDALQSAYDNFAGSGKSVIVPHVSRVEAGTHEKGVIVHFKDGQPPAEFDFIVMNPPSKQAAPFAEQLGLELDERGDIAVKAPFSTTSVPGVFAAGDSATMIKAVGQATVMGALNAAGIIHELMNEELGRV